MAAVLHCMNIGFCWKKALSVFVVVTYFCNRGVGAGLLVLRFVWGRAPAIIFACIIYFVKVCS